MAATGRGSGLRYDRARRGDRILWWREPFTDERAELLQELDGLREGLNRELFLGLQTFEGHFAEYAPGAGYERHRDTFRDDDSRLLSLVAYLNDSWGKEDGGELVLYPHGNAPVVVGPLGGTLVLFLSREMWHEVRPACRSRRSVTGWFRVRAI